MTGLLGALSGPLLCTVVMLGLTVESGLLVGVAIPGTALALGVGVAAHTGVVSLPMALASTALGTIAGGQLAYRLGHRRRHQPAPFAGLYRLPIGPWPPLRRGMHRRPVTTVLAAQWLASGRLLVPRAAGWSQMGHRRFTTAHTPSASTWAATLTSTGYAASTATRDHIALGLGLAAGAAVLIGGAVLVRQRRHRTPNDPGPASALVVSSATLGTLPRVPATPRLRHPRRLLAAPVLALVTGVAFTGCALGPEQSFSDDTTVPGPISGLVVRTAGAIQIEPTAPGAPTEVHRDIRYRADAPPSTITRRDGTTLVLDVRLRHRPRRGRTDAVMVVIGRARHTGRAACRRPSDQLGQLVTRRLLRPVEHVRAEDDTRVATGAGCGVDPGCGVDRGGHRGSPPPVAGLLVAS